MKSLKNKHTATSLLGIFILSSFVACGSCKQTQSLTPITEDMIALASTLGDPFLVNLLLGLRDGTSVDMNAKNPDDNEKRTGLHYAAGLGVTTIIKVLLERGAQINTTAEDGLTPLHSAVIAEKILSVLTLLQYPDLDPNGKFTNQEITPLAWAVREKSVEIVKALVKDPRTKINERFQYGFSASITPLKFAQDEHDNEADPAKQSICKAIIDALKEKGATE